MAGPADSVPDRGTRLVHRQRNAPTTAVLAAEIRRGRLDPRDALEATLDRIAECDDVVGAFVEVDVDGARAQARECALAARRGETTGPLHGVPVGVKDLFDVRGQQTKAGSKLAPGPAAAKDAVAVARLREAGGVIVGRTRTHEFAWGITTQHADLGGTRNPWDSRRVPGGSSGGSAAAVAAGMVPLALGTDTGASIRLPALWCGLVGHKPSYGTVPLDGVVPLARSLDHGGALVRDATDARLALEVLSGRPIGASESLRGRKVGIVNPDDLPTCAPSVVSALESAAHAVTGLGGRVQPVVLPLARQYVRIYRGVQAGEALEWHRSTGHWPASKDCYGADVRQHLEAAEALPAREAAETAALRTELRHGIDALFDSVDLLLMPVAGCGPSWVDDPNLIEIEGQQIPLRDAVLPCTALANLCGLPACSLPIGSDEHGLPTGVQLLARTGRDKLVLDAVAELSG